METRSRTAMDSVEFFTVVIPPCVLCYLTSCLTALGYITFLLDHRYLNTSMQMKPWGRGTVKTTMLIYYNEPWVTLSHFLGLGMPVPTCAVEFYLV